MYETKPSFLLPIVKILASAVMEEVSEAAVDLEMEGDMAAGEAWVVVPSTLYT